MLFRSKLRFSVSFIISCRPWLSTVLLKVTISSSSLRFLSRANRHAARVTRPQSSAHTQDSFAFIAYIIPRRLWLSTVLLKVTSSSYISHFASCLSHTLYGFVQLPNTPHILRTHCHTFAVTRPRHAAIVTHIPSLHLHSTSFSLRFSACGLVLCY